MMKGLSSLFFSYDERRRTKKRRPHGGSVTEITIILLVPPCLGEALMRGFIAEKADFHGPGDNDMGSCLFLQNHFMVSSVPGIRFEGI